MANWTKLLHAINIKQKKNLNEASNSKLHDDVTIILITGDDGLRSSEQKPFESASTLV